MARSIAKLLRDRRKYLEANIRKWENLLAADRKRMASVDAELDTLAREEAMRPRKIPIPKTAPARMQHASTIHWKAPDQDAPRKVLAASVAAQTLRVTSYRVPDDEPLG